MGGPPPIRDEALARLEIVADTYLSVGTPVQRAARHLLARREELQRPIRERVTGNLEALRARVRRAPATLCEPEGGWSAVLRLPATRPEEDWVLALLEEDDVLVHPGYFFDFDGEAFVVAEPAGRPRHVRDGRRAAAARGPWGVKAVCYNAGREVSGWQ